MTISTPGKPRRLAVLLVLFALAAGALVWLLTQATRHDAQLHPLERRPLGLMTTLPIYWGENADLAEMLQQPQEPHWVRETLERRYELVPLDTLDGLGAGEEARLRLLLLAQPRALSPGENVAIDAWVRGGGHVLLFADPMLTGESRFGIGDRRRPQDVALLSPILARWGLRLEFDPDQPAGEGSRSFDGVGIPVNLAGQLALAPGLSEQPGRCELSAGALVARCAIGAGQVLVVADAAVLDNAEGADFTARFAALTALVDAGLAPEPVNSGMARE